MDPKDLETAFRRCLARAHMRVNGYSYRMAAPLLEVGFQHLHAVLHGKRISASLVNRVLALPPRRKPVTHLLPL